MISDLEARKIASSWHGGGGTALYALSSTGAINTARADHDIEAEIWDNIHGLNKAITIDRINLFKLLAMVEHIGPRGPVDGWSTLTW